MPEVKKNQPVILGTFEGECADSNITNLNGLDITRPVWEAVFNSQEYKRAIDMGWYIGYLGHPEDPNCMEFEHACIVMTEGHIASNGKVYGKFNLIDTPVGRVVKSFIDAGVTFGISVRGAGDITGNSVEPDTFVFRGFDLVSFPAFPESVPKFSEIAASTDLAKRKKYQAVCASVKENLDKITSAAELDIIQTQFAPQSEEYKMIEDRKADLIEAEESVDISNEQLDGITDLYLSEMSDKEELIAENARLKKRLAAVEASSKRKMRTFRRIAAAQVSDMQTKVESTTKKYRVAVAANTKLKDENTSLTDSNLKYKQKADSATSEIGKKDKVIATLNAKLAETVNGAKVSTSSSSNLEERNRELQAENKKLDSLLASYQTHYAELYAKFVGVKVGDVRIAADTSVKTLQRIIASQSVANLPALFTEPQEVEIVNEEAEDEIITI